MQHAPAPSPEPFWLRAARAVALLALCVILSLLAALAVMAVLDPLTTDDDQFRAVVRVILLVALCLPVLLIWLAYRLRLRSWWWVGGGFLAVAPVLAYLAADDPAIRRPMTMEEITPLFPGAEESYRVLMRYTAHTPESEAFKAFALAPPKEPDQVPAYATANRLRVESTWVEIAPLRRWYAELTAFDRIGDLSEASYQAPVPAYSAHRAMAQTAQLRATLLALEGRGDEAIETLLPVLDVGWKMQATARTLVRASTAFVTRRMALDGAEFTLARARVSPEMRARLQAALGPAGGEAGARRLVAIEDASWASGTFTAYYRGPDSSIPLVFRALLRLVAPLLINPNRTINEAVEITTELQDLAARRQPLVTTRPSVLTGGFRGMKNLGGQAIIMAGLPNYQAIIDSYWRTEDRLAAVRRQLAQN